MFDLPPSVKKLIAAGAFVLFAAGFLVGTLLTKWVYAP